MKVFGMSEEEVDVKREEEKDITDCFTDKCGVVERDESLDMKDFPLEIKILKKSDIIKETFVQDGEYHVEIIGSTQVPSEQKILLMLRTHKDENPDLLFYSCDYNLQNIKKEEGMDKIARNLTNLRYSKILPWELEIKTMRLYKDCLTFFDFYNSIHIFNRFSGNLEKSINVRKWTGKVDLKRYHKKCYTHIINNYKIKDDLVYLYRLNEDNINYITDTIVLDLDGNLVEKIDNTHRRFLLSGESVDIKIVNLRKKLKENYLFQINYPNESRNVFFPKDAFFLSPRILLTENNELFCFSIYRDYSYNINSKWDVSSIRKPCGLYNSLALLEDNNILFAGYSKYRNSRRDDGSTYPADVFLAKTKLESRVRK